MTRQYSNRQINQAGEILKKPSDYNILELNDAQDILTYWRTLHAYPINTFQATLRDKISRLGFKDAIIAQRLKRTVSIISKLIRFDSMKLATIQDIAGLRGILKNVQEVRALEENYLKSSFKHVLTNHKDYIKEPALSGYRGIHLIYQFDNIKNPQTNGLKVELQLRTKLQHTWATAVETMGTFLDYSLKSSQGPEEWLSYFKLVSAGFSILERCPVSTLFVDQTEKEIFSKIVIETLRLNVHDQLKAFSVAADHIHHTAGNSKYSLITLNIEKRIVNVKNYSGNKFEKANIDYTNIERQITEGSPLQVVLVSTGSIESLRKAYPSFFLDTREFLSKVELIASRANKL